MSKHWNIALLTLSIGLCASEPKKIQPHKQYKEEIERTTKDLKSYTEVDYAILSPEGKVDVIRLQRTCNWTQQLCDTLSWKSQQLGLKALNEKEVAEQNQKFIKDVAELQGLSAENAKAIKDCATIQKWNRLTLIALALIKEEFELLTNGAK